MYGVVVLQVGPTIRDVSNLYRQRAIKKLRTKEKALTLWLNKLKQVGVKGLLEETEEPVTSI